MTKWILPCLCGTFFAVSCYQPEPGQRTPAPQPTARDYPFAEKTVNPDHVISPHDPYNVVNVKGYRPGELVRDPTTGQIFRVP